jgi:hypothetical protein
VGLLYPAVMRARTIAVYEPRDHEITGSPDQVAMVLRVAHAQDRLRTPPEMIRRSLRTLPDGRVSVQARLMTATPVKPSSVTWARGLTIGAVVAVVSLGLWLAAFYAVRAVAHSVAVMVGNWSVGVLVMVGLVLLWAFHSVRSGHACRGMHCDGCSRH